MSIRARLTVTSALLVLVVAGLLITGIYLFMRYAPTYHFAPVSTGGAGIGLTPVPGATPAHVRLGQAKPAIFPVTSRTDLLGTLLIGSLISLGVLALLAGAAGWLITGRTLRPIRDITSAARLAAAGQLDHRLALTGRRDEFTDLADTFDEMLARLERVFGAQRRFAVNASHELRTPLAATQAVLDVALAEAADRDDAAVTALARQLRGLNSQSVRIVDTLLDLAHLENTELATEAVAVPDLVAQAVSDIEAEAGAHQIQVGTRVPDCRVLGEPTLLTQLLRNLVQNAVRHNHLGGTVTVDAALARDGRVRLRIQNTGAVIDPQTLPLLTEPFYRAGGRSGGRAGRVTGHGLGLALAEAIAYAHGTQLELAAPASGGLTATIELPPAAPT